MRLINRLEYKNKIDNKVVGYLEIENKDNGVIFNIYGDIVANESMKESDLDIAPTDVLDLLKNIKDKDLIININSPGGSVFAGIGIYNAIKQSCHGNITVNITGMAGSIASVIAMCGKIINMPVNTQMMIHKPSCTISGNADDLVNTSAFLNKIQDIILNTYMINAATGVSRSYISNKMNDETLLSADECSKLFKNVVVLQTGFNNKCKTDDKEKDKCDSKDEDDSEDSCKDEKDKCKTDSDGKCNEKNEEEKNKKIKCLDNFDKELSIFLCLNKEF